MSERLLSTQEVRRLRPGEVFKGIYVASRILVKSDKNGRPYWDVTVMDQEGSLEGRVWSDAGWWDRVDPEQPLKLEPEKAPHFQGKTLGVVGKVTEFRGTGQTTFTALSLLSPKVYPPSNYVPRSPFPLEELEGRFDALVASCGEPVQGFLRLVFRGDLWERFRTYPAAVANHHAYAHGLLEHTLAVTEAAAALGDHYRSLMPLDRDLVVAGGLLHDLGKVEAYAMNPVPEVTLPGAVVDHVALGYARFMDLVREHSFPEDKALALAHILLSHHGQREYGSPVVPATPEALVVSAADELDFRLFCWMDSFRDAPEDQVISPYHAAAQRRFWRGPVLSEPSEG